MKLELFILKTKEECNEFDTCQYPTKMNIYDFDFIEEELKNCVLNKDISHATLNNVELDNKSQVDDLIGLLTNLKLSLKN